MCESLGEPYKILNILKQTMKVKNKLSNLSWKPA